MGNVSAISRAGGPHSDHRPDGNWNLRSRLAGISRSLHHEHTLDAAEVAIGEVAQVLGMRMSWWTPDASNPYHSDRATEFSRREGWPEELMDLWRKQGVSLYSPFHIRSRFETLPFVTAPDLSGKQSAGTRYGRANEILARLDIRAMLHVPVHLLKGRVGLVNWAGDRERGDLHALLPDISGELLAIGHLFMRNFIAHNGGNVAAIEEKARLTRREWDCLRILAQGYREAEAAALLEISKSTLRFHIENVVRKLGCKNRTQAIALAAQLGLLGPIGS